MKKTASPIDHPQLLRDAGLRATPGRLRLLAILEKEPKPVSVAYLERKMQGELNQVTLYRALEALAKAGIVNRVNLEHDHAHYELTVDRPHHHHVVCRTCGHVEDIEVPHSSAPERDALKNAKEFARIDSYSLEFFGACRTCV